MALPHHFILCLFVASQDLQPKDLYPCSLTASASLPTALTWRAKAPSVLEMAGFQRLHVHFMSINPMKSRGHVSKKWSDERLELGYISPLELKARLICDVMIRDVWNLWRDNLPKVCKSGQCKTHHGSLFRDTNRVMCGLTFHLLMLSCHQDIAQNLVGGKAGPEMVKIPTRVDSGNGGVWWHIKNEDTAKAFEATSSHSVLSSIISPYSQPSCAIFDSRM